MYSSLRPFHYERTWLTSGSRVRIKVKLMPFYVIAAVQVGTPLYIEIISNFPVRPIEEND